MSPITPLDNVLKLLTQSAPSPPSPPSPLSPVAHPPASVGACLNWNMYKNVFVVVTSS